MELSQRLLHRSPALSSSRNLVVALARLKPLKSFDRRKAHNVLASLVTTLVRHRIRSLISSFSWSIVCTQHSAGSEIVFDG